MFFHGFTTQNDCIAEEANIEIAHPLKYAQEDSTHLLEGPLAAQATAMIKMIMTTVGIAMIPYFCSKVSMKFLLPSSGKEKYLDLLNHKRNYSRYVAHEIVSG